MASKTVVVQQFFKPIKILKWKVREGNSLSVGRILLVYQFEGADPPPDQRKLRSTHVGIVSKLIGGEGAVIKTGEPLLELQACIHPTVMNDMCAECGADLRKENNGNTATIASVPMVHSIPELKVSEELAQKLGKADGERLLRDRKLVLLVDLDQTLIHTTNDNIPANIKDVFHFQLYGKHSPWYHTRLRPRTNDFLFNISQYFELHICTFGARNYAHMIAMLLDPDQQYFSNRILSRDECFDPTSKKANLKALFPCGDDLVCIIDDREDVWSHASNLIHVKPYHFFQHTGDINAPPGLNKQENDNQECVIDLTKSKFKSKENGNKLKDVDENDCKQSVDEKNDDEDDIYDPDLERDELGNEEESNSEETEEPNGALKSPKEKSGDEQSGGETFTVDLANKQVNTNINKQDSSEQSKIEQEIIDSVSESKINRSEDSVFRTIITKHNLSGNSDKAGEISKEELKKKITEEESKNQKIIEEESKRKKISEEESKKQKLADEETKKKNKTEEESRKMTITEEESKKEKISEEDSKKKKITEESRKVEDNKETENRAEVTEEIKAEAPEENKSAVQKQSDKLANDEGADGLIEVDDPDDYLLYLEDILKRIHGTFYEEYDARGDGSVPDLKQVIPKVRRQVLADTKLVFSGLVPTHARLEESRAYQVARGLGANVTDELGPHTTHLVAVRSGTAKVNAAKKKAGTRKSKKQQLKIVTPDWLWCCAERWERVREEVFPLDSKGSRNRHPPPHYSSPEHNAAAYPTHETPGVRKRTPSGRFMDTINPLMSFSSDDIADMDKEVEDMLDSEDSDSEIDSKEQERESFEDRPIHPPKATDLTSLSGNVAASIKRNRKSPQIPPPPPMKRKRSDSSTSDSSSSDESLTGEFPRGFKRSRDRRIVERYQTSPDKLREHFDDIHRDDKNENSAADDEEEEEEFPSTKFRRGEEWSSDLDIGQGSDDAGSEDPRDDIEDGEWNVMGAALEREFLSNN